MDLRPLTIQDKETFKKFLGLKEHRLSVYAFENIYIWKGLFEIYWTRIGESLCVFFKDRIGCFLYLPPLTHSLTAAVIEETFVIMDGLNSNKEVSRIENIEEDDLPFYRDLGYSLRDKPGEYVCVRAALVQLRGNRFKAKRACCNYFTKHYDFEYLGFSLLYRDECLRLYNLWMRQRRDKIDDAVYRGMLEDSLDCFKVLLDNYRDLGLIGRLVRIGTEIKAFTFGFRLNPDTFCILYEVADPSSRGLAQYIFREFCSELRRYPYINIMDDSGLENLKKVKLSYNPERIIPAYIACRKSV